MVSGWPRQKARPYLKDNLKAKRARGVAEFTFQYHKKKKKKKRKYDCLSINQAAQRGGGVYICDPSTEEAEAGEFKLD
jgi:hypothetical protein